MSHADANAYANAMIPQTWTTARLGREARIAIIWATAAAVALAAFLAPRFEQPRIIIGSLTTERLFRCSDSHEIDSRQAVEVDSGVARREPGDVARGART